MSDILTFSPSFRSIRFSAKQSPLEGTKMAEAGQEKELSGFGYQNEKLLTKKSDKLKLIFRVMQIKR